MRTLCLAFILVPVTLDAQHWRGIGRGVQVHGWVQLLYGDRVLDRLIGAGPFPDIFNENDSVEATGIAAWNGQRWDSLGHRLSPGAAQTHCLERYDGTLYASGNWSFQNDAGQWTTGYARFDENTLRWSDLGCYNPQFSGLGTMTFREDGTGFYFTGHRGDPCSLPAANVFTYDGSNYASWALYQQIPYHHNNYVGFVFEFRGMWYMTGLFRDPYTEGSCSLMRYNGDTWEYVPGWGQLLAPIKEFSIHNDTLYIAGTFRRSMGAPGDLIARFDGSTWDNMGGGLFYEPAPMSGAALDLLWHHDELWVVGMFTRAGDIAAECVAKWNGRQWCSLPADFQGHLPNMVETTIGSITSWRDSVYIAGGFSYINGEPVREVAQWLGGDAIVACSTPVEVGMHDPWHTPPIQISPNPVADELRLVGLPTGTYRFKVYDSVGRKVLESIDDPGTLHAGRLEPGMYLLVVLGPQDKLLAKAKFQKL